MNPQHLPHTGAELPQTGTGGADTVPERKHPGHLLPARRLFRFLEMSLWPLTVIAVSVLATIMWSVALFWLVIYPFW
jgi:hypothetical protein